MDNFAEKFKFIILIMANNRNDITPKPQNGIELLLDSTTGVYSTDGQVNEERIIAGIKEKRAKKEDILRLTHKLRNSRNILERELFRLERFSKTFNKRYATSDNKCYSSANIMLEKIHSHYLRWKDILSLTSARKRQKGKYAAVRHSLYDRSLLNKKRPYTPDFYGMKSFGSFMDDLKEELDFFMKTLVCGLNLCKKMLNEERRIKESPDWIKEIYSNCYNIIVSKNRETINWLVNNKLVNSDNQLYQLMLEYKDKEKFIQDYFHEPTETSFNDFVFTDIVTTVLNYNISFTEQRLWGRNYEKIKLVRFAIAHFDQLVTPHGRNGYNGADIMDFIVWCDVCKNDDTREDEERILYDYLMENYKGNNHVVGWSSVFETRKTYEKANIQKISSDFDARVKELHEKEEHHNIDVDNVDDVA